MLQVNVVIFKDFAKPLLVILFKWFFFYRETLHRVNIVDHKNGSQTYSEMKKPEFDYTSSNGSDQDIITVPDIPYIVRILTIYMMSNNVKYL